MQPSGEKVIRSACSRVERSEEVALSLFYRSSAGAQIYGRPQEIESQGQFRDKELRSAIQGTLQQDPAAAVLSYDPVPVYGVLPVGPKMTAAMQVLDHKWARAGGHRA